MPLILMKRYTRQTIRANPDWLFVFGDNFEHKGYGGQARHARGEPNAIGIPTKHWASNLDGSFLTDDLLEQWEKATAHIWDDLEDCLIEDGTVVWPSDGIGTGLARLPEQAPLIAAAIDLHLGKLKEKHT